MPIGQHIQVGSSMFYQAGSRSQSEWETASRQLLDEGQVFLAYDLAKTALEHFPESLKLKHVSALVLLRTGAVDEARKILEPLCLEIQLDEKTLKRAFSLLRRAFSSIGGKDSESQDDSEAMEALADLYREIGQVGDLQKPPLARDEETLGLLARVYKESWKQTGNPDDAIRCRDAYQRAYQATGGYWTGINAAAMSWILGQVDVSRRLATEVLGICEESLNGRDEKLGYWVFATMGEAQLYLGEEKRAIEAYRKAADRARSFHAHIVSSFQQLRLLQANGFPVPDELLEILHPPAVVIFTGHMIDGPDRHEPRFPPDLEDLVRKEIDFHLDELDARIGYCSAACGSDLLFIEAMQDRGAEVNVILPFDLEDFKNTSLRHAGREWISRFNKGLKLATSVKYVTEERYLEDELLFEFTNKILMGHALLRAQTLETKPDLIAVWDGQPVEKTGGTASNLTLWPDEKRRRIINISELRRDSPAREGSARYSVDEEVSFAKSRSEDSNFCRRVIRCMLFADIVGYSQIQDPDMPFYMYDFLQRIGRGLESVEDKPDFIRTWGDAIFVVFTNAISTADYAFNLLGAVLDADWTDLGLPAQLNIRVALHSGPVFEGIDPIVGQNNFYGAHVNRAARIEPVTVPGCVYASEQFAAQLTAEQTFATRGDADTDRKTQPRFVCEYVGMLQLPKSFGLQATYHIRRGRIKTESR